MEVKAIDEILAPASSPDAMPDVPDLPPQTFAMFQFAGAGTT
jgi:hypothetical protein